ncbi:slipin family protein [Pokkaliibacter sp. MBI-7]|uniref:slipin family protein n=1 Tax=Pokkaliibacter sp. MBI-7 TaxID=3040600 RepID=UPI002448A297|nr:slipin family protein [Pokkaliibacter sp. MBI-7]MDH2431434.1 slipin family protein [Pokkaliibacter sp. MBI-7]
MLIKKMQVADEERVLLYRQRQLQQVLQPGSYRFYDLHNELTSEVLNINSIDIQHVNLDVLLTKPAFRDLVDVHQLAADEAGLLWLDNQPHLLLEPLRRLVTWKGNTGLRVEIFPLQQLLPLSNDLLSALMRRNLLRANGHTGVFQLTVAEQSVALLYENGILLQTLQPGRYGYWAFNRELSAQVYDLKWQALDISGQEILTRDRVSLRINLTAAYRITDPVRLAEQVKTPADHLYRRLQLALSETVGTRTLDALLADKDAITRAVDKAVRGYAESLGLQLEQVGIKDIILPGEMKDILNQVVQAEKAAEANLIKRREETAATRSLHNTAKMLENNPVLLRLKELEALERVAERINHLNVYGGLDQVMNGLVTLGPSPVASARPNKS